MLLTCPNPSCAELNSPAASECCECGTWLLAPLTLIEQLRERVRAAARAIDVEDQAVSA